MNRYYSPEALLEIGINLSQEDFYVNQSKTVIVGMSGGVDSSVSALIIKLMGYKTIGMFMKNWEEIDEDGKCSSEADYSDVVNVCEQLEIPYYSVNFSKEYRDQVFTQFIEQYQMGHTPNPDILCNREIKFKVFLDKAKSFGADFLATGHYCQKEDIDNHTYLKKGLDQNKDQSYFLYAIKEKALQNVLFPIGHLQKTKVRDLAKIYNLNTFNKKDSTGICFIGERNFRNFLSQYINSQKGIFVQLDTNRNLGPHEGMCYYTVGQRKGLGIGGPGGPWFVVKKDLERNIVFVVEGEKHPALYYDYLLADDVSWITAEEVFPLRCMAKIRYRQKDQPCIVSKEGVNLRVEFLKPQRAVSIKQSIVFYKEHICLGGAVICKAGPSYFEMNKFLPQDQGF